jgi:hypothetical protein
MRIIEGGGFRLLTDDPILSAVVRRCAELEHENLRLRRSVVFDVRSVRRDVRSIRKQMTRKAS